MFRFDNTPRVVDCLGRSIFVNVDWKQKKDKGLMLLAALRLSPAKALGLKALRGSAAIHI